MSWWPRSAASRALGVLPTPTCPGAAEAAAAALATAFSVVMIVGGGARHAIWGQGSEAGSPNGTKWSTPMNEVISAMCSPRRVSTLIDQAWCAPASPLPR
jgi:hypothetical protein